MYEGDIVIHDRLGRTQADRRAVLLALLEEQRDTRAKWGLPSLTWTEEPDGLTCYTDGVAECRITWAEVVAEELEVEHGREPYDGLD
jgi:hypothetical protein